MLDCISRASYLLAGRDECKILYHTDDARMAEDTGADFMLSPSANPADYLKSGFVGGRNRRFPGRCRDFSAEKMG